MIRYLDQMDLAGKRVFLRVDFNVPLDAQGAITDDARIRAALPSIKTVLDKKGRLIVASHLGRPKGADPKASMEAAATRLAELLRKDVILADDCIGDGVKKNVQDLKDGGVLMLENLRFHKEEEANDESFSRELASFADVWINDAFGAAHRAHASTFGMARFVAQRGGGLLLKKEVESLGRLVDKPEKPFVAILGGSKVSDKVKLIESLLLRVDALLIGGAMAYSFLKVQGLEIGGSRFELDRLGSVERILNAAKQRNVAIHLPVDHVCGAEFKADTSVTVVQAQAIPAGQMGLDIGPKTTEAYRQQIRNAKTVFWNGPMGAFEMPPFAAGTQAVAQAMADNAAATTVVAGEASAAAVAQMGLADRLKHVSTGGDATLEFIEGQKLPGIAALES
jgi:phosphoglycerate kinase